MPEVGFAVWSQAVQTRFVSFQLPPNAGITGHLPSPGKLPSVWARRGHASRIRTQIHHGTSWGGSSGHCQALKLCGNLRQDPVNAHLRPFGVALFAHGADKFLAVVPVALQAGLTEAVATRRGHRFHKHFQTDGAAELLLREEATSWRAHACWRYDR